MKTSDNAEFSAMRPSTISFRSLSSDDVSELLPSLYLRLDFDARRARFGGAVSDHSILQHCRGLDLNRSLLLGCVGPVGLVAAIELHPLSPVWEDAEFALAEQAGPDMVMIRGNLLQLAAFAAGKRGCSTLVVSLEASGLDLLRMLRSMGRVRIQGDSARVDLGEYARLHRSGTRP